MRAGTPLDWQKFLRPLSLIQRKSLDECSDVQIAVREEDYIRAQEIATSVIYGKSDYPPSLKRLMDL
jgi:hypothetical protein